MQVQNYRLATISFKWYLTLFPSHIKLMKIDSKERGHGMREPWVLTNQKRL